VQYLSKEQTLSKGAIFVFGKSRNLEGEDERGKEKQVGGGAGREGGREPRNEREGRKEGGWWHALRGEVEERGRWREREVLR
jgi:hypothetical protein